MGLARDLECICPSIEATVLGPSATRDRIRRLCFLARNRKMAGVCVPPALVPFARSLLDGSAVRIVSVVNFPFGDMTLDGARAEVSALATQVDEIDLVAPLPLAHAEDWSGYEKFLRHAIEAAESVPVKVILETAAFSERAVKAAATCAIEAGAAWLKTSTGFHPCGGASVHAVRLLRFWAPSTVGVKASGGIRTPEDVEQMLDAGADRIGMSAIDWIPLVHPTYTAENNANEDVV